MIPEDDVYEGAKLTLTSIGWRVIAGQPPNGNDSFPVVEIKDPQVEKKGSHGSFKPDLLAIKKRTLLLVECKPLHSASDASKLLSVLGDASRLKALGGELDQRRILLRHGFASESQDLRFAGALAHGGEPERTELGLILVSSWNEPGSLLEPTTAFTLRDGSVMKETF